MIFVTGSTGFVGNHVVSALLALGHKVRCLVRPGSEGKLCYKDRVDIALGDIFSPDLAQKMAGCKAVIHLIGIIREFPKRCITFKRLHVEATKYALKAAKEAGINRFLHMSALGTGPKAVSCYHRTKYEAEELVRQSGFNYTIFRPSVIYGPYDHFVTLLSQFIRFSPIMPIIGDGQYRLQPVHVYTVALAFVLSLYMSDTYFQTFEIGGPEVLTYDEIVDSIARLWRKEIKKLHLPVELIRTVTYYGQHCPLYPLTEEMLIMLLAGNVVQKEGFYKIFPLRPINFKKGIGFLRWSSMKLTFL